MAGILRQRSRWARATAVLLAASLASGCLATSERSNYDPLEPLNRRIFAFNNAVDRYALKPVAKGYDAVVPSPVQNSVSNFFKNLWFPVNFVNNLLQGKPRRAGGELGRFVINTTVGIGGLFDPAASWGLEPHPEDFGQTFGVWGIHPGPYIVLPFLGPSNLRDSVGLLGDYGVEGYPLRNVDDTTLYAAQAVQLVNARSRALGSVEAGKAAALDFYVFARDAYYQNRASEIRDGGPVEATQDEDLYGEDLYDDDLYDDEAFDEDN